MHHARLIRREKGDAAIWGRRDVFFQIPMSRNLAFAILLSLLIHAFLLFGLHRPAEIKVPVSAANMPLDVELTPLEKPQEPLRQPPAVKRTIIAVKKSPSRPHLLTVPKSRPVPESQPAPEVRPKMSFLDYVNAARKRRDASSNEYPVAPQAVGPSPDAGRPKYGTSGIFRIIRMDDSSAEFSFLGWHSEYSNSHKEVFDVDAGPDGNVRLAVVRKMIEIIRRYYQGDFNWDSQRLGGVVVLSARPKDDKALEAFMMKEFFTPS